MKTNSKKLEFTFNDNIDLLYGLNYCINRKNNTLKIFNTKEQTPIVQNFYDLYLKEQNKINEQDILKIGNFIRPAKAALDGKTIDCPTLKNYLAKQTSLQKQIIKDLLAKPELDKLDFERIKQFYGFNISDDLTIYLSYFVAGGFGFLHNNQSTIVLGITKNPETGHYSASGTLICKLIHEFSHPYVNKLIDDQKLSFAKKINYKTPDCYQINYLHEAVVHAMEIIFSTEIFGNEYKDWAIKEQENGFKIVPKMIKVYYDNQSSINNMSDYFQFLIKEKILKTN